MRANSSRLFWLVYAVAVLGLVLWGLGLFDTGLVSPGAEVAGWLMTMAGFAGLATLGALTRRRRRS